MSLKRVQELLAGLRDEQGDEADNPSAAHAACPTQSEGRASTCNTKYDIKDGPVQCWLWLYVALKRHVVADVIT